MSESTPILITLSETCACAAPSPASANAPANIACRITLILPPSVVWVAALPSIRSHAEVFVQLVHLRVDLAVRDHVDHPAALHHIVAIGDRRREAEVLLDQQDREALRLELSDRAADLLHDDRGQPLGRF